MKEPKKIATPYRCKRYGILNPFGDVWTPETFDTMDEARQHVASFWASKPDHDLSKYTIVPVRVTVATVT